MEELGTSFYTHLAEDKVKFFNQDALFGPEVNSAASAEMNAEIRAAGNCLAADLNTAAVFHLMRVVEHGIRRLAATPQLDVNMSPRQISMAAWSRLIKAMEIRIRKAQKHKGAVPLDPGQLQFYRGLLLNIDSFKDLWRNDVMHTRGDYNSVKAEEVLNYVRAFTRILAEKVPLK
jgi:hypothetical protein